jgi:hypothetical protein
MMMNLSFFALVISLGTTALFGGIVGHWAPNVVTLALTLFFGLRFFGPCFKIKPAGKLLTWMTIAYLSKWNFIKGGLDGQKKFGTVNVEG